MTKRNKNKNYNQKLPDGPFMWLPYTTIDFMVRKRRNSLLIFRGPKLGKIPFDPDSRINSLELKNEMRNIMGSHFTDEEFELWFETRTQLVESIAEKGDFSELPKYIVFGLKDWKSGLINYVNSSTVDNTNSINRLNDIMFNVLTKEVIIECVKKCKQSFRNPENG